MWFAYIQENFSAKKITKLDHVQKIDITGDNHSEQLSYSQKDKYHMLYPLVIPFCTDTKTHVCIHGVK